MANKAISALSAATTPDGTEVLPIVQGGATVKATARQVAVGGVAGQDIAPVSVTAEAVTVNHPSVTGAKLLSVVGPYGASGREFYVAETGQVFALQPLNLGHIIQFSGGSTLDGRAANTFALSNGANAQTLLISRSFSDASNFSQLKIAAAGSAVTFSVNELGSGIGTLTSFVFADAPTTIIPPTSDPHVVGALWNDAGTLTISAG